jgi:hypothetical protein
MTILVTPARIERATNDLGNRYSIQLSYGAGSGATGWALLQLRSCSAHHPIASKRLRDLQGFRPSRVCFPRCRRIAILHEQRRDSTALGAALLFLQVVDVRFVPSKNHVELRQISLLTI